MYRSALIALPILAVAACSQQPQPVESRPSASPSYIACADLPGKPTVTVVKDDACSADGSTHYVGSASQDCADGRKLYWNDYGWGYSDGTWSAHGTNSDGQKVPPAADRAACQG